MFCMKCGSDLPEDSRFCRSCGQTQGVSTGGGAAAAPARATAPAPQAKKKSIVGIFIGVILLSVFATVWFIQRTHREPLPLPEQGQAARPQLHTQTTGGDKAFTVNAGGFHYYNFEVVPGAYNVSMKGHFQATGGTGSDIEVYLLTADDLVNWQNGHQVNTLYNSGRVTQETLNITLPNDAGKYCLVFNNKFSFLTPKAVEANIALSYYTH